MLIRPAERISSFSEYYFSKKLREIAGLSGGMGVLNLAIGNPDLPPPPSALAALQKSASEIGVHGYQSYQGLPGLRQAISSFYAKRYAVHKDLTILPLMGSKEGITHISLAYLNPGDEVLVPSLSYPAYTSVTKMVGAVPVHYPLKERIWTPDWESMEEMDTRQAKILWANYPHMPTGASADQVTMERLVDFCKKRNLLLVHDNPYSFILNDRPLSLLSVPGSEEVCIELNSLSKTFNMAGWRVGWVIGREELIKPILQIKSNMDSGQFRPIQEGAIKALESDDDWYRSLNETYTKRQELVVQLLVKLGCEVKDGQSGLFVWARVPSGDGGALSNEILDRYRIFIAPGFIFGEQGKSYVRVSLCSSEQVLQEAIDRIA